MDHAPPLEAPPTYTSTSPLMSPAEDSDNPLTAPEAQGPANLPGLDGAPVRCEYAPPARGLDSAERFPWLTACCAASQGSM